VLSYEKSNLSVAYEQRHQLKWAECGIGSLVSIVMTDPSTDGPDDPTRTRQCSIDENDNGRDIFQLSSFLERMR
jgi:hypothetical protein